MPLAVWPEDITRSALFRLYRPPAGFPAGAGERFLSPCRDLLDQLVGYLEKVHGRTLGRDFDLHVWTNVRRSDVLPTHLRLAVLLHLEPRVVKHIVPVVEVLRRRDNTVLMVDSRRVRSDRSAPGPDSVAEAVERFVRLERETIDQWRRMRRCASGPIDLNVPGVRELVERELIAESGGDESLDRFRIRHAKDLKSRTAHEGGDRRRKGQS
jgi:hypothetical protein